MKAGETRREGGRKCGGTCLWGLAPQMAEAGKTTENRPLHRQNWVRIRRVTPPRKSAFILAGATLGLFILAGAVRGLFILGQFVQAGATLGLFIQGVDDPLLEQAGAIIVDGISRALGMWSRVVDLALFCSRIRITGPFAPPFSITPLDSHDGIACMDEVCFCERLVFKALCEVA